MWRYNRLIRRGWTPIYADTHEVSDHGLYWTNVLMAKGGQRKVIRLDGTWKLSALQSPPVIKGRSK